MEAAELLQEPDLDGWTWLGAGPGLELDLTRTWTRSGSSSCVEAHQIASSRRPGGGARPEAAWGAAAKERGYRNLAPSVVVVVLKEAVAGGGRFGYKQVQADGHLGRSGKGKTLR
jgi:hypothetical protein